MPLTVGKVKVSVRCRLVQGALFQLLTGVCCCRGEKPLSYKLTWVCRWHY